MLGTFKESEWSPGYKFGGNKRWSWEGEQGPVHKGPLNPTKEFGLYPWDTLSKQITWSDLHFTNILLSSVVGRVSQEGALRWRLACRCLLRSAQHLWKGEDGGWIEQREELGCKAIPTNVFLTLRVMRSQNARQSCPKLRWESQDLTPCVIQSLDVGYTG